LKIIETFLTLKHCNGPNQWKVMRTHYAPFNSENDNPNIFNFGVNVSCKGPGIETFTTVEAIMAKTDFKTLTKEQLLPKSKGKIYKCEYKAEGTLTKINKLMDWAGPHFWLGSHQHASELIFAPYTNDAFATVDIERLGGNQFFENGKNTIKGPLCIERVDDLLNTEAYVKPEKKGTPLEAYTNAIEKKIKTCADAKDTETTKYSKTIKIHGKNPNMHIIFVVGNSGRYLDPIMTGQCSLSEIAWHRSGIKTRLFIENILKNREINSNKDIKKALDDIKSINEGTDYGYTSVEYTKTKATIQFFEINKNVPVA
jgi:hypothetical protein